jgi:two-component system, chemotaxis family, protein-glutamate methylesterase/glutaminase
MKGRIFVIGASLSGIGALSRLVGLLPANFPSPLFITQHVGAHSPGMLPQILSNAGHLPAVHPKNADLIEPGRIYVAPPDRHMLVQRGYIRLSPMRTTHDLLSIRFSARRPLLTAQQLSESF